MSSLFAQLLAGQQKIQTRKALVVIGLQNDFTSPNGKLSISNASGYLDRIKELVPAFRQHGEIIWVRSEYRGDRVVNASDGCMVILGHETRPLLGEETMLSRDTPRERGTLSRSSSSRSSLGRSSGLVRRIDEILQRTMQRASHLSPATSSIAAPPEDELFLSRTSSKEPCCIPGTYGAEYAPEIRDLIQPGDIQITKSYYSAFTGSNLTFTLHTRMIRDLYFVGCSTNLSVFATASDAARHGMQMFIVEDCLGYRNQRRHDEAVRQMVDDMGAYRATAASVVSTLGDARDTTDSDAGERSFLEDPEDESEGETRSVRESSQSESNLSQSDDRLLSEPSAPTARRSFARFSARDYAESADIRWTSTTYEGSGARSVTDDNPNAIAQSPEANKDTKPHVTSYTSQQGSNGTIELAEYKDPDRMSIIVSDASSHTLATLTPYGPEDELIGRRSGTSSATPALSTLSAEPSHGDVLRRTTDMMPKQISESPTKNGNGSPARVLKGPQPPPGSRRKQTPSSDSALGPDDKIAAGDTKIVFDLLSPEIACNIFQELLHEVHWQHMYHAAGQVPRLVCCQGDRDTTDGSMPVYRHPSDQSLPLLHWTPNVIKIRREVEKRIGHKLNHVLIQLYRNGQDFISEHSDKTLDVVTETTIVNVSFGAQRTMRFRTKRKSPHSEAFTSTSPLKRRKSLLNMPIDVQKDELPPSTSTAQSVGPPRETQRVFLPHNSMLVVGLATNAIWLHGIAADKRLTAERSQSELAYGGMRISLTFRRIGTFISSDSRLIWGQGATSKDKREPRHTVNGNEKQSQRLIDAFGTENHSTDFDWQATYGAGFDVLHLKTPLARAEKPTLFLSGDESADLAIKIYLSYLGVEVDETQPPPALSTINMRDSNGNDISALRTRSKIMFRDVDVLHTQVEGEAAILLYLDRAYARYLMSSTPAMLSQAAKELEILTSSVLANLRPVIQNMDLVRDGGAMMSQSQRDVLQHLEDDMADRASSRDATGEPSQSRGMKWLVGNEFGIADCAIWPLIRSFRATIEDFALSFPSLDDWAHGVGIKDCVKMHIGGSA